MAEIQITNPATSGGTVNPGVLQMAGGVAVSGTSRDVTDQLGTATALKLSTTGARIGVGATAGTRLYIEGSSDTISSNMIEGSSLTGVNSFTINDGGSFLMNTSGNSDNLRNIVGKNASNTPGLQPFKFNGGRSRGTLSAPTAVQADDGITSLNAFAYNGSAWTTTKGGLYVYAAENWTTLANGTYITLRGAAVGGTTVTEWARFQSTGLTISTIANATTDTDKFLVSDGGAIKYRTGAELLSDIGGQATITNPVTGTGTATRVAFWSSGSAISSSSALNWDNANGRLGIGVASPSARLQVTGDGVANTVRFESSASTNLFTLSDQGLITAFAPATTVLTGTTEIIKSTSSFIAPSAGSGSFRPLSIAYTINNTGAQTGTATGIYLNATETALGGMQHNLMVLQKGAVNQFVVSPDGFCTTAYFDITNYIYVRGSIAAGKNGAAVASAVLQADSTTRGFLPPRMITTQKTGISAPATGLVVYDTTLNKLAVYTGAAWETVTSV